jgi:hypothetical protein
MQERTHHQLQKHPKSNKIVCVLVAPSGLEAIEILVLVAMKLDNLDTIIT